MPKEILAAPIRAMIKLALSPNLSLPKEMCGVMILTRANRRDRKTAIEIRPNRNDILCSATVDTHAREAISQTARMARSIYPASLNHDRLTTRSTNATQHDH